jgi:hypothetical protein
MEPMRRGTHRLAVWTVVACIAASCAPAGKSSDAAPPRPRVESTRARLADRAVAVVVASRRAAVASPARAVTVRRARPPIATLRRPIGAAAPLRVALVGDSVAYSVLPSLQGAAD